MKTRLRLRGAELGSFVREHFNELETVSACPVCQSVRIRKIFSPDVYGCMACQVHFRNPRPTQAEIQRSYNLGTVYETWQGEQLIRDRLWNKRLALVRQYIAGGRLLDIGAGDGHFLSFASAHFEIFGTETSQTAAGLARTRGFDLQLGQLTDLHFEEAFDAITMWHTLEHMPNPGDTLRQAGRLLQPNGWLILAVPNETFPLIKNRIKRWVGMENQWTPYGLHTAGNEVHLTHFTPKTIRRALASAGFRVIKFGVDDVYVGRSWHERIEWGSQLLLNRVLNWHVARAMFLVCQKV